MVGRKINSEDVEMSKKIAVLQVADTGPLESLVVMLRSVGYDCRLPATDLKNELRRIGLDTVLNVEDLIKGMGYDAPMALPTMSLREFEAARFYDTVYVDVKAHRNAPRLWQHYPSLKGRVLWYRINGGAPEHVIKASGEDCGDERNPPCPVLTPNLWYAEDGPWSDRSFACWPPFHRFGEYAFNRYGATMSPPMCLVHNLKGWGYQELIGRVRNLGVLCYGDGSPDGLLQHRFVPVRLASALCTVHLKSSDAPGYAIYETLAAGCPLVCSRRLIWRNRMQSLLIPGKTCLVFDRETHDTLSPQDVLDCTNEIAGAIKQLSDPAENVRIGEAGRQRLREVTWSADRAEDVQKLAQFMKHFYEG